MSARRLSISQPANFVLSERANKEIKIWLEENDPLSITDIETENVENLKRYINED